MLDIGTYNAATNGPPRTLPTPGGGSLPYSNYGWMRPAPMPARSFVQPTRPSWFQTRWRDRDHNHLGEWQHSPVDVSPNPPVHIAPEPFIRPTG